MKEVADKRELFRCDGVETGWRCRKLALFRG